MKNWKLPFLVFTLLLIHGSLLGLSDDEAYYWVLSRKLALGYAFHPPAVAWSIGISERLFGWIPFFPAETAVRFPAAAMSALILGIALRWLRRAGMPLENLGRAALILLSFAGFFVLSWMMVPDLPLFLGWMILFSTTWNLCFSERSRSIHYAGLALGAALILLSKYSGILAIGSSALCLVFWASGKRRSVGLGFLLLGVFLAAIPIGIWNSEHEWASLLYQMRDRHGSLSFSLIRYLRFLAIELILAGPIALFLGFWILAKGCASFLKGERSQESRVLRFLLVWTLPAALVFCLQPAFSDFKIHWAFIVWWPLFLGLAWISQSRFSKALRLQCIYGLSLIGIGLLSCHLPLLDWAGKALFPAGFDARWDPTNDLYGWKDLGPFLKRELPSALQQHPVIIGSRYQTAAQASFYLGEGLSVTLLPRDLKELDEWPTLKITETEGPSPSKLNSAVFYIADNRYSEGPRFPSSECKEVTHFEKQRMGIAAKQFTLWECLPAFLPMPK